WYEPGLRGSSAPVATGPGVTAPSYDRRRPLPVVSRPGGPPAPSPSRGGRRARARPFRDAARGLRARRARRGPRLQRAALLQRGGPTRLVLSRGARPRARRRAVLRLQVARPPDHREPRPDGGPQGGLGARPGDRDGPARRRRPAPG